jgi:hypothetical protein
MIIIDTLFEGEPSMDNPPVTTFPNVSIGDVFTYKGERCTVTHLSRNKKGFFYKEQSSNKSGFMFFWFYQTIPSQMARNGLIKGRLRNLEKKEKLIRYIEGLF